MTRRLLAALAAVLLLSPAVAAARPGDLDRTFAGDGMKVGHVPYGSASILRTRPGGSVLVHWSGVRDRPTRLSLFGARGRRRGLGDRFRFSRAVAVGRGTVMVGLRRRTLVRTGPDGRLLRSWGDGGKVRLEGPAGWGPHVLLADRRGRVVVVGTASTACCTGALIAARLTRAGRLDRGFGRDGFARVARTTYSEAGAVLRDGSIAVVGVPERRRVDVLLRLLDPAGRLDRGFGERALRAPFATPLDPIVVAADARGRILLGLDGRLMRFRRDGTRELTVGRRRDSAEVTAVAEDPAGRIVVALRRGERPTAFLRRLHADGSADRGFGREGRVVVRPDRRGLVGASISSLAFDGRGRILAAGEAYEGFPAIREDYGTSYALIARLRG